MIDSIEHADTIVTLFAFFESERIAETRTEKEIWYKLVQRTYTPGATYFKSLYRADPQEAKQLFQVAAKYIGDYYNV